MSASAAAQVVEGCHVLGAQAPGDSVWGHISLRDRESGGIWLKAGPLGFDEVDETSIVLIDFEGRALSGSRTIPYEYPLHTEILRARPDIESVVHAHPSCAISLAATGQPLHAFSNAAGPFARGVPRFERPVGLVDSPELGTELAQTLGSSRAAFMVGHGIVAVGSSVATAVTTAILLERACQLQLMATTAGGITADLKDPGERYIHTESDWYLLRSWQYMLRQISERDH